MGSEQSHRQPSAVPSGGNQGAIADTTTAAAAAPSRGDNKRAVREPSSPRPSIGSDTDVPYVSYTINRPIGESPKSQAKSRAHRLLGAKNSSSPNRTSGLSRRFESTTDGRPSSRSLAGCHDIVVVREFCQSEETVDADDDVARLRSMPVFLPIMRGALNVPTMRDPDVLDKLDFGQLNELCWRYERHLKQSADCVAAEQTALATRIREIDFAVSTLLGVMTERQKKYARYVEKLGKVHEISSTLERCQSSLRHTIDTMEALNDLLPPDGRLEPFFWTSG